MRLRSVNAPKECEPRSVNAPKECELGSVNVRKECEPGSTMIKDLHGQQMLEKNYRWFRVIVKPLSTKCHTRKM